MALKLIFILKTKVTKLILLISISCINPGSILATPLLSSPNYHSWSRVVTVAALPLDPSTNCTLSMVLYLVLLMMTETLSLGIVATP
jgi:hypothetical protein